MATLTDQEMLDAWGADAHVISDGLARFTASARALSSDRPRLIDEHPQQWVGLFDGHVEVTGDTIETVMEKLDEKGYPRQETIVRFIDRNPKTLIL